MERRTFLKRVGQAVAGLLALPLISKKVKADEQLTVEKVKKIRDELVIANGMDEVQLWPYKYKVFYWSNDEPFHIIHVTK